MKNDFRLTYPLWMMGFIVLLGFIAYAMDSPTMQYVNTPETTSVEMTIEPVKIAILFGAVLLTFILLILFSLRMKKHNLENPDKKISLLSIRPAEYLEQDEGMTYITRKAVQKVYTFTTGALPSLVALAIILQLSRLWIIYGILVIGLLQYLIYYLEIRKHFKEEPE